MSHERLRLSMQRENGRTLRRRAPSRHDQEFSPDQFWPDHYGGDARDAWSDVFRIVRDKTDVRATNELLEEPSGVARCHLIDWHPIDCTT